MGPALPGPSHLGTPSPALAPDQLPQNNTLVALPIVAIENILSFMSYDEISQLRLVRPPRDPRRPLRGAESGEGRGGERVPRGGSPPLAQPAPERGACPSRPKVSASVTGACPDSALASGLGAPAWGNFALGGPVPPARKRGRGRGRGNGS